MATITKKGLDLQEKNAYFQKFMSKSGQGFGLRLATPKDAANISSLFRESYNYEYPYSVVYDIELLKRDISKSNKCWVLCDLLEKKITVGCALVENIRYIAHAGCLIVKEKFRRQGITSNLAAAGLIAVTKRTQFKDVLRLNIEVRGPLIKVQNSAQNAGAIPFGIIPNYLKRADNRYFDFRDNKPCYPQFEESGVLYSIIFRNLWKKREKNVFLLENEDLIFLYNYINSQAKKMNQDTLILKKEKYNKGFELYSVSKDYYMANLKLYGYIKEKSINNLLNTYKDWSVILWKIPTTEIGISSMSIALKKGFKVVGYDIGFNNINWTLFDSIIFAYYPKGNWNLSDINCVDRIKPLFNRIKQQF